MNMTPDDYIQSRLDDQISWYSRRSQLNQRWFKGLRIVEIVLASTIPFLVGQITTDTPWLRIIVGGMGVCIAVVSGLVSLYKFHENWEPLGTVHDFLTKFLCQKIEKRDVVTCVALIILQYFSCEIRSRICPIVRFMTEYEHGCQ